jgi:hypothetical protein
VRYILAATWVLTFLSVPLAVGLVATSWPSCGPRFTVNEQFYKGQTVFWLRKLDTGPLGVWPVCSRSLSSPAAFSDVESATRAAKLRAATDGEERVVATVP